MDDEGGGGAPLVLVCQHREVLVGLELSVDGVDPLEGGGRLAAAADLPEGGPVHPHRLRASLTLVDRRRHCARRKKKVECWHKKAIFLAIFFVESA